LSRPILSMIRAQIGLAGGEGQILEINGHQREETAEGAEEKKIENFGNDETSGKLLLDLFQEFLTLGRVRGGVVVGVTVIVVRVVEGGRVDIVGRAVIPRVVRQVDAKGDFGALVAFIIQGAGLLPLHSCRKKGKNRRKNLLRNLEEYLAGDKAVPMVRQIGL
jgi:hypothetical protein